MTDAQIAFMDLSRQNEPLTDDLAAAVRRVVESGQFTLGPEVEAFEEAFAAYCGTRHAVAVNNGTSALHLALLALGVAEADEVVTVANTFIATVEAIRYCGARPVYADIDPNTLVMDVRTVQALLTDRTKAIVPVHLYGNPVDMTALKKIADEHGIPVLEDSAQAHGASHAGRRVGGWGKASAFSFYPTKNLGAIGEGGIVTTDDEQVAETCRLLRHHGQSGEYFHDLLGFNYRMTAFQGACLNVKLPHLDRWNSERRALAAKYRAALEGSPVTLMQETADSEAVYHLFVVLVPDRDRVREKLEEKGIATRIHYPVPLFQQPSLRGTEVRKQDLPVTRSVSAQVLSLPFYPGMPSEQIEQVAAALIEAVG